MILARERLDELIAEGRIVAKTDIDLAQTPLGAAVRAAFIRLRLRRTVPSIRSLNVANRSYGSRLGEVDIAFDVCLVQKGDESVRRQDGGMPVICR